MPLGNKSVSKINEQTQYSERVRKVLGFIGNKCSVLIKLFLTMGMGEFNVMVKLEPHWHVFNRD